MRIGVVYPQTESKGSPEAVRRIGLAAEALGYDHLLAYDHVVGASHDREPRLWGPYTEADPFHDPFVMFAHLAAITERIEFATGVLILPQRQTVLVAKQAADVDLLSGQRLRLGVGVGWNYVEYDALGQDFASRGARADEQIGLLRRLWAEELLSYEGRFDRMEKGCLNPRPARMIPVWVGGFGPAAFRRGARLGDGFMFAGRLDACLEGWATVRRELASAGRAEDGFGADLLTTGARSVDQVLEGVDAWRAAGGTHVSVVLTGMGLDSTDAHLDFMDQVRRRLG
jgi:probable F420-dependent oxidoreductase